MNTNPEVGVGVDKTPNLKPHTPNSKPSCRLTKGGAFPAAQRGPQRVKDGPGPAAYFREEPPKSGGVGGSEFPDGEEKGEEGDAGGVNPSDSKCSSPNNKQ